MKFRETQVIVFANQKGGCGKTSSLVSTAAAFAASGYSVCVVDTDPQCDSTGNLGVDPDAMIRQRRYTLADAYLSKVPAAQIAVTPEDRFGGLISVVPGHRALSSVEIRLEREVFGLLVHNGISEDSMEELRHEHRFRLRASLDSLRGRFDVVLIDTPPNLGFLMTSALVAADWCVIPTFPSGYDLKALQVITRTVEKIRKSYNPGLSLAGVLLGNYDRKAILDKEIHVALCKRFTPALVFATTIGRSVRFRESTERGITIFEHPDAKEQAANCAALVKEMINRGAKGAFGATLNPFPGTELVEQVIDSGLEDVETVNG
ncbi:MinD/ParA/CobQ/CobA-like protein [Gemmata obscuriglobus]|uniref:ParA family protein n=1 Tax=Gemmata obscuriglobus TaxID=114 RepID=A0A2Z3H812_9BACT|nr:ParA family protein [Gemmata obscuriglobus]AWM39125.1 ParA family protein [Gemmata obscuriglobus]QEG27831.1 MinD/ParA/CobQ/CobA-like protein [Gemmata obscuriglobus]VTS05188.1 Chromosome segregation ATPase OS=Leptonema illini DSM 21528 GN=Lepil_3345 PE=4 SV=1: CbiA [Gemmata obscuriglobus UQM 2246]